MQCNQAVKDEIMIRRFVLFLVCSLSLLAAGASAQEGATNIVVIMDASGSMLAAFSGGQTRIDAARAAVINLANSLPATDNASLWVYGHRLPQDDPAASCLDIEQVLPLAPVDPAAFASVVTNVQAIGYTPIARTLQNSITGIPAGGSNVVVLMSDGEESCGGDPCAVVRELIANGIEVRVNTIGVAADANTRAQLQCIADVSGGAYFEVNDAEALTDALTEAAAPPAPSPGIVQLVNPDGSVAAQIGFELIAADGSSLGTQLGQGEFPPGEYTARVAISPELEVPVTVTSGETTTIPLPEPGTVRLVDGTGAVTDAFDFTIADPETGEALAYSSEGIAQVPAGDYTVTVNSSPPFTQNISLEAGATVDILLNVGTINVLNADGSPSDEYAYLYNAESNALITAGIGPFLVPPGVYDVEVSTVPQVTEQVLLSAGQTVDITLAATGTIEIVGPDGALTDDYIYVYNAETGELATGGISPLTLAAGAYNLVISTVPATEAQVIVEAGQTVQVEVGIPGTLEVVDDLGQPNDVYVFVYDAETDTLVTGGVSPVPVAAGTYRVEFSTSPATETEAVVTAGATTTITSPREGQIELVTTGGQPSDAYVFVYDAETDELVTGGLSPLVVLAGTYRIELNTTPAKVIDGVVVETGETTTVTIRG